VGGLDIGVSSKRSGNVQKSKVVVLLGTDNIQPADIPKDAFVVYIVRDNEFYDKQLTIIKEKPLFLF
jgi:hypothetical protein